VSLLALIRDLARRFLLLTSVAIGALCGVVAVLFHWFVEFAREMLIGRAVEQHGALRVVLTVLTPAVVFAVLALVIQHYAPRAVGANLARVRMAYSSDIDLLGVRSVVATFVANPLSLGAGAPLGPEGPIVVVGSGVSMIVARWLRLPRKMIRDMIPVGVAAGIAGIFNAPITGVVFALEEVLGSGERGVLGGVLVGAVSAAVVEKALLGGKALLEAPPAGWNDARELLGFALVGIATGLVSGVAIAMSHRLKAGSTSGSHGGRHVSLSPASPSASSA
jgi:CIC family chloride channel protein